ncbi:MAG: hypothetical protein ACE5JP_04770 [Candidatus Bipolaricaulia bacterium]
MKKTLALVFTLAFLLIFPFIGYADSPITSTPFSDAYLDIGIVKKAKTDGVMSLEIAEYLSSPANPVDIKAAVINALSWQFEGKNNATLYSYYLALKYRRPLEGLDMDMLTGDEIFSLGYLTVMDDYFHPEKAVPLLERAKERLRDSLTVSMILALAKAQAAMSSDWCEVWELTEEVTRNEKLKQDLRWRARKIILAYMVLYRDYC